MNCPKVPNLGLARAAWKYSRSPDLCSYFIYNTWFIQWSALTNFSHCRLAILDPSARKQFSDSRATTAEVRLLRFISLFCHRDIYFYFFRHLWFLRSSSEKIRLRTRKPWTKLPKNLLLQCAFFIVDSRQILTFLYPLMSIFCHSKSITLMNVHLWCIFTYPPCWPV